MTKKPTKKKPSSNNRNEELLRELTELRRKYKNCCEQVKRLTEMNVKLRETIETQTNWGLAKAQIVEYEANQRIDRLLKKDSPIWIPVSTEHLKGDRSTWSKKSKNPDKHGLRHIAHGQYEVRRDKLESLVKPSALNLYRS